MYAHIVGHITTSYHGCTQSGQGGARWGETDRTNGARWGKSGRDEAGQTRTDPGILNGRWGGGSETREKSSMVLALRSSTESNQAGPT